MHDILLTEQIQPFFDYASVQCLTAIHNHTLVNDKEVTEEKVSCCASPDPDPYPS